MVLRDSTSIFYYFISMLDSPEESQQSTSCSEDENSQSQPTMSPKFEFVETPKWCYDAKKWWNLAKVIHMLGTRQQAIAFAEENCMVPKSKMCNYHKKPMSIVYTNNKTVGSFTCHKCAHACKGRAKVSRANGTWFENVKMSMPQIFYLMYAFANKWSYSMTIKENFADDKQCLSKATVCDWFKYCRETVILYQLEKQTFLGKIGGPGKVVQIDETKFSKRKYNKGQHIEGQWVLGMIEDGSEDLRLEVCPNNIKTAEVLVPLIQKHVAEGTTIYINVGEAYDSLKDHNYVLKKLTDYFPANPLCMHTQKIESQWNVVKQFFSKDLYNREYLADFIIEYLWRRHIKINKCDPFEELIKAVKHVYKH
ncbi:uncharacterized protein LOC124537487 isoform X1 [Vanessa cardui]|uniref:uncharacterized protein LOC124537487 isoform X1 n=1 Tax=Vanessa cardui TaxID=171605 RepID=UPI001F132779|nr:uncharacterized protein LOC124537487 isoform X1 [Vanessa cardui]